MKKIITIFFIALLGAVACTKEADRMENPAPKEKGLVAVTMSLRVPVELTARTKANNRDEKPLIDAIRVAVFGTSGYPQAYAYAEPVNKIDGAEGLPATYEPGSYATENDRIYYFKVLLPVYEGEAHVHIVANGPTNIPFVDQTEHNIMSQMETTGNVGGYWARAILPDGILTVMDENGIMQLDTEGNYIPSPETAKLFKDLVLIRNFAEITLTVDNPENDAQLLDVSWALVNDPQSGAMAPMADGEFVDDYKNYVYDTEIAKMILPEMDDEGNPQMDGGHYVIDKEYDGYMVSNTLNTALPSATSDEGWTASSNHLFSYERVDPNKTDPTYIMLRAHFKPKVGSADSDYSYYRVDLMDENVGGYFPLYRNYMYQIKIHKVGNRGASTPQEASLRNSGGNISMSAETKTLTDVSDGTSRLFVEFVEKTFTSGGTKSFWVYYIPDVSHPEVIDNSSIQVTVKDMGTALANGTISKDTERSTDKLSFYNFTLKDQDDDVDLTSVIQVKASNGETGDDKSTLYRDLTVTVMKKMQMTLFLDPNSVTEGTDKKTVLHIALSDTLQPSMFPLEFYIEDTNRTLNPTGYDGKTGIAGKPDGNVITVPVKIGESIINADDDNSYYFIRTVNWSEYEPMRDAWVAARNASESTEGIIDFTTQLKTIKENGATTVYVDNEYFNMGHVGLACAHFAVSILATTVSYRAGSTTVTVSADDGISWTASVDNGAALTRASSISGEGTDSFTLNYGENTESTEVTYTITVTSEGLSPVSASFVQRRAPAPPESIEASEFSNRTYRSEDEYLTIQYANGWTQYSTYLNSGRNNRTITFTPQNGAVITKIEITYSSSFADNAAQFSPANSGSNTPSGRVVTWTGSSSTAVTYTCGARDRRVESIKVTYN